MVRSCIILCIPTVQQAEFVYKQCYHLHCWVPFQQKKVVWTVCQIIHVKSANDSGTNTWVQTIDYVFYFLCLYTHAHTYTHTHPCTSVYNNFIWSTHIFEVPDKVGWGQSWFFIVNADIALFQHCLKMFSNRYCNDGHTLVSM